MSQWWQQRNPREQRLLKVGGLVLALSLLIGGVYLPLLRARDQALTAVQQAELDLLAARRYAALLGATPLSATGSTALVSGPDRSLMARVDQGLRDAGLSSVLSRIEPDGDGRVRLWLEDASFDTVVAWLEGLSDRSRVRVIDASVDRAEIPGQVRVRLTLERG